MYIRARRTIQETKKIAFRLAQVVKLYDNTHTCLTQVCEAGTVTAHDRKPSFLSARSTIVVQVKLQKRGFCPLFFSNFTEPEY